MSNGLIGMDVDASRALADRLGDWGGRSEEIRSTVVQAETLADLPTGVSGLLDQIGADGVAMAAAIRRAAAALEAFTIELDAPHALAAAVANVHAFRGSDNDPELDRRLRVLRDLVGVGTNSRAETAQIVAMLLSTGQAVHVAGRDVNTVVAAMDVVHRLSAAEATGAISSNDARIDRANGDLRTALSAHASSDEQLDDLVAAFLADGNQTPAATLLASVITGVDVDVVDYAHQHGLDYGVAATLLNLDRVDQLTAALQSPLPPEAASEVGRQRSELLQGLIGADDLALVGALGRSLDGGMTARQAMAHAGRMHQIRKVAATFDLNTTQAEVTLDELTAATTDLVESGWQAEDAAQAAGMAALGDLDLAQIETFAADEHVSLVDAATWFGEAKVFAMTESEYRAFKGLQEHFDALDKVRTGKSDGIVSLEDLAYAVRNSSDIELIAAAQALIDAPDLRHRLDSAAIRGDVVGAESFGRTEAEDHKISKTDMEAFGAKQVTNFLLRDHREMIDVAAHGGTPDQHLSKEDFGFVLAHAEELGLDEAEVNAVQLVLDADWYDKTFWQANGDSVILASAVVVGAVLFVASGGLGTGLSATLIGTAAATAGGAATGATITVGANYLTGEDWHDDLGQNAALGAIGGLAGAGLISAPASLQGASFPGKVVALTGAGADVAGLAAAGMFDPVLRQFGDDVDVAGWKSDAQSLNYAAGGAALLGSVGTAAGRRLLASDIDAALPSPNFSNYGGEGVGGFASQLPNSAALDAAAAARAEAADALASAAEAFDDAVVAGVQRSTGLALDGVTALVDGGAPPAPDFALPIPDFSQPITTEPTQELSHD